MNVKDANAIVTINANRTNCLIDEVLMHDILLTKEPSLLIFINSPHIFIRFFYDNKKTNKIKIYR